MLEKLCMTWNDELQFKLCKTAFQFALVHVCFLLASHQQLRNDFNRDGGEGNRSQPPSKHFTSLNTCFGLSGSVGENAPRLYFST